MALTNDPVLVHFKEGASTRVRTDGSDSGLGAVFAQRVSGNEHLISHASSTLLMPIRRIPLPRKSAWYSSGSLQCFALTYSVTLSP